MQFSLLVHTPLPRSPQKWIEHYINHNDQNFRWKPLKIDLQQLSPTMGSRDIYYKLDGQYHKIKQNDDFEEDPRLHPDVVVAESNNLMNYKKNQCFKSLLIDRSSWLVGLLVLQSLSSFILRKHEKLLIEHTSILQFLTMLVGAGGNAGNQASVRGMSLFFVSSYSKLEQSKIIIQPF